MEALIMNTKSFPATLLSIICIFLVVTIETYGNNANAGPIPKPGNIIKIGKKTGNIVRNFTKMEVEQLIKSNSRRRHAPNSKDWIDRISNWIGGQHSPGERILECGCWGVNLTDSFTADHNCSSGSVCLVACNSTRPCPAEQPWHFSSNYHLVRSYQKSYSQYTPYHPYAWICGPCQ